MLDNTRREIESSNVTKKICIHEGTAGKCAANHDVYNRCMYSFNNICLQSAKGVCMAKRKEGLRSNRLTSVLARINGDMVQDPVISVPIRKRRHGRTK